MDDSKERKARFYFKVKVSNDEYVEVQADQVIIEDSCVIRFVVHTNPNMIVAAFKGYEYFVVAGEVIDNENI